MAEESRRGLHARYDAEVDAARNLAAASGWAFVDLERYSISCGILRRVPAETCCRLRAVPMVDSVHRRVMVVDDVFQGVYIETNPELLGAPTATTSRLRSQRGEVSTPPSRNGSTS
jgi:hypothetical protein